MKSKKPLKKHSLKWQLHRYLHGIQSVRVSVHLQFFYRIHLCLQPVRERTLPVIGHGSLRTMIIFDKYQIDIECILFCSSKGEMISFLQKVIKWTQLVCWLLPQAVSICNCFFIFDYLINKNANSWLPSKAMHYFFKKCSFWRNKTYFELFFINPEQLVFNCEWGDDHVLQKVG